MHLNHPNPPTNRMRSPSLSLFLRSNHDDDTRAAILSSISYLQRINSRISGKTRCVMPADANKAQTQCSAKAKRKHHTHPTHPIHPTEISFHFMWCLLQARISSRISSSLTAACTRHQDVSTPEDVVVCSSMQRERERDDVCSVHTIHGEETVLLLSTIIKSIVICVCFHTLEEDVYNA